MEENKSAGACTPSFSSAELRRLMTDLAEAVFYRDHDGISACRAEIEKHVQGEILAEREECAAICDKAAKASFSDPTLCATAIRMRHNYK